MRTGLGVQHFISPMNSRPFPRAAKGEGVYIFDDNGKRYLDGSSGAVVSSLGHGNRRVGEAIKRQVDAISFAYARSWENRPDEALVEMLGERCGGAFDSAFFLNGGSDAIEAAMKFARQLAMARGEAGRWKIISRLPSYHGATFGALTITGDPVFSSMFEPMIVKMPKVPAPMVYRTPAGMTPDEYVDYCADALEEKIIAEGPESVLAFFLEPVGGTSSGALVSPGRYYQRVREICSRYGVLLIFDEVMSGVGRSGKFLAAHYWPDAQPDLVVLGKGLGAGYSPISAIVTSSALVNEIRSMGGFAHGHTYVANPLGCAIGCAVLEELTERNLIAHGAEMGRYLMERLNALKSRHPMIGDVRGAGLQIAVEIVADPATKEAFPGELQAMERIKEHAMSAGLNLLYRRTGGGGFGEWFMICPPLIIQKHEVDELVSLFSEALTAFERVLGVGYEPSSRMKEEIR